VSEGLRLPRAVAAELIAHARDDLPNEACGLLSGLAGTARVTRYHPARNALASPTAFELHPQDLVRILYRIEGAGEELAAIFHSHPRSEAIPSSTDIRHASYGVPYVLLSLRDGVESLRGWEISGGVASEVPLTPA
jgi:proteasome lid subunit RPN8/RPN11